MKVAIAGVVRVLPRPLPVYGNLGGELATNLFANNRQGAASLVVEGARLPVPLLGPAAWRLQGTLRRAGDARTPGYYLVNTGYSEINGSATLGIRRGWGGATRQKQRCGNLLLPHRPDA